MLSMYGAFHSCEPILAEPREIIAMACYSSDPAIEIGVPGRHLAQPVCYRSGDVFLDSFVVLHVKPVAREGVRAVGRLDYDVRVGHRGRPRILADFAIGNDTFGRQHNAFGRPGQESIAKSRARVLPITIDICLPDVNDGPISVQRGGSKVGLAVDRIFEWHVIRIEHRDRSADAAAPGQKTEAACRGIEL